MAYPLQTTVSSAVFACVISMIPATATAQMVDVAPSGSFSFSSFFGAAEPQALPLQLSDDSSRTVSEVTNPVASEVIQPQRPDVQTTRLRSRLVRNTWSVGVFR